MSEAGRIGQLVGTFLPLYGVVLTVVSGLLFQGVARAVALTVIPLAALGLCAVFGERIAYDGNMLYVALVFVYVLALCVYYPALLIVGLVRFGRQRRRLHEDANP